MTGNSPNEPIRDKKAIAAGVILYMLAPVGMSLLPLLVGAASDHLGLTPQEAGLLATADYAGITVAAVFAAIYIRRISWRKMALAGILILIIANPLCLLADSLLSLVVLRFLTELGTGLIFSLAIVAIGDSYKPDRFFAFGIGLTVALSTGFFLIIPGLIETYGLAAIFIAHALIAVLVLPILPWVPHEGSGPDESAAKPTASSLVPLALAMLAFTLFTAAEGGVWAYLERLGNATGMSGQTVGQVLAITQVASVLGAITASWLSTRFGRVLPLAGGIILFAIGSAIFLGETSSSYIIAACITQFCYVFGVPYLLLACVELDPSRRYYVLTTGFKLGGMALGPAIISGFLMEGSYAPVAWVAVSSLILCLAVMVPLAMMLDRRMNKGAETQPAY